VCERFTTLDLIDRFDPNLLEVNPNLLEANQVKLLDLLGLLEKVDKTENVGQAVH
jgi:hypothetical protein